MLRLVYLTLFVCLFFVFWLALSSFPAGELASESAQQMVYNFILVPTATPASSTTEGDTVEYAEQFTVQLNMPTVEGQSEAVAEITSAEIRPSPQTVQLNKQEPNKPAQSEEQVRLSERRAIVYGFKQSRTALSSLTYILNVADADGILVCDEVINFYEQTTAFKHFNVSPPLEAANDYFVRSMNIATIGVNPLYQFCQQTLIDEPEENEIAIRKIKPASIWTSAVSQSNRALEINHSAIEWLHGSTRLLTNIYDKFDINLNLYKTALTTSTTDSCAAIRHSYAQLAQQSTHLDLGDGSEYFSSYDKYDRAISAISESGRTIYEYCVPAVSNGIEQLAETDLH
ncbi:MAG: hypothetical protein ACPG8W_06575, partial [Candidatus Promineifilaceae bacterium]